MLAQLPEPPPAGPRVLLVTGMSGAGRSSALKFLEDFGYEAVDNLPLGLFDKLLATGAGETDGGSGSDPGRPLAIGND